MKEFQHAFTLIFAPELPQCYLFFDRFPGKFENNGVVNITCWPLAVQFIAIFFFLALTLAQRQHHCGFLCLITSDKQATASDDNFSLYGMMAKVEPLTNFDTTVICQVWHVTYRG